MTAPSGAPRTRITAARDPRSVPLVRLRLTQVLRRWNVPPATVDDAALLLSELLTNAVRHGAGPTVTILAGYEHGTLHCQVHNDTPPPPTPPGTTPSPAPPTTPPRPPDPLAESGRGLPLVDTLATRWGTHPDPRPDPADPDPTDPGRTTPDPEAPDHHRTSRGRHVVWFHLDTTGTPPVHIAETDPDILRRVLAALRAR